MYIALLADIHANLPAFEAVLDDIDQYSPESMVIAGDLLGYYCDADEVVQKIRSLQFPVYITVGNHDLPIIQGEIPKDIIYRHILRHNLAHLAEDNLAYLRTLEIDMHFEIEEIKFHLYHGTPDNSLEGRLYPDNEPDSKWFRPETEVFILGHTHYPCIWRKKDNTSVIINPGAVGQPRDGIPVPSWALLDTQTMNVSFNRVNYDQVAYAKKLRKINWDERSIKALFKNKMEALNAW